MPKIVYAVQINDYTLTVRVECPNCGLELEIFDSPTHEADRLCPSDACSDLRFKISSTVQVFTGVKQPENTNKQDHGTCWNCEGKGWVQAAQEPERSNCISCGGTGRNL